MFGNECLGLNFYWYGLSVWYFCFIEFLCYVIYDIKCVEIFVLYLFKCLVIFVWWWLWWNISVWLLMLVFCECVELFVCVKCCLVIFVCVDFGSC